MGTEGGRHSKAGAWREDNSTQTRKLTTFGKVIKSLKYSKLVAEKRKKSVSLTVEEPHCPRSVNFTNAL